MEFIPLYYGDRIKTINPDGDVGIITLWSPVKTVEKKLAATEPCLLDARKSRVAVIANLYGDGMLAMFCNLLYNPQIKHLVAMGQDMALSTSDEIRAFLLEGVEDAVVLGRSMKRIKGTGRLLDLPLEFDLPRLQRNVTFASLGKLSDVDFAHKLQDYFTSLGERPTGDVALQRLRVAMKEPSTDDFAYLPSDTIAHQVRRPHPLDCWEELVYRTMKFGRPIALEKGGRLELQNVKVVIVAPRVESESDLAKCQFDLDRFRAYQAKILSPELPKEISYTYGNRLRGYFAVGRDESRDTLAIAARLLRRNPESRHAYISLWDTANDLRTGGPDDGAKSTPCLTTLFFRLCENKRLGLTATYRTHNLLTAWLENVYGLMAILDHVARGAGLQSGPITVISHSLTINPMETRYAIAEELVRRRKKDDDYDREKGKYVLREDPNGHFAVSLDEERGEIVATHVHDNVVLKKYVGRSAQEVEEQVARDMAVSVMSHALWLGRQLGMMEARLRAARSREKSVVPLN